MRKVTVEGTDVHLHETDGRARQPLLVWLADALSPWRSPDAEERFARDLAARSGWAVASVQYAPEGVETFPLPLTRAYSCLVHLQERGRGRSPVAVGGNGFGASLAAASAMLSRRYGSEPPLATILLAPLLDARLASPSWRLAGEEDRHEMDAALAGYAPGLDRADPLLSPALAESLDGLPTTAIVTASEDPMRDDGERYAERLRAAGVTVLGHRYPGTDHAQACGGNASGEGAAVLEGLAAAMRLIVSRSTQSEQPSSSRQADASPSV
jgi:acetyl esterase